MEEKTQFIVFVGSNRRFQIFLDGLSESQVREILATVEKTGVNGNIRRSSYVTDMPEIIRPIINGRLMVQKNGKWVVEDLSVVLGDDEA